MKRYKRAKLGSKKGQPVKQPKEALIGGGEVRKEGGEGEDR